MRPNPENETLKRLLGEHGPLPGTALARGTWLRKHLEPLAAARAGELIDLRERAAGRLPDAAGLLLTGAGLEQATHQEVAAARAARVAERIHEQLGPQALVLDATCGLGGEAAALAREGVRVLAADLDPTTAACARHNFERWRGGSDEARGWSGPGPWVIVADALAPPLVPAALASLGDGSSGTQVLLVDPSRRADGQRTLRPADWSPSWPALAAVLDRFAGAVVKLAPAARPEELGPYLPADLARHWVWVSRRGELAELVLYTGVLATEPGREAGREACLLSRTEPGRVLERHLGPAGRAADARPLDDPSTAVFLGVPDPTLVTSGLLGPVAAAAGHAPLGSGIAFTGGPAPATTAALRNLRVIGTAKLDRRAVRRLLAEHGVGPVQVLARGLSESTGELERRLAGPGAGRGLLVVARCDSGRRVWLAEEAPQSPPG